MKGTWRYDVALGNAVKELFSKPVFKAYNMNSYLDNLVIPINTIERIAKKHNVSEDDLVKRVINEYNDRRKAQDNLIK
jgi:hypothetical protein